MTEPRTIVLAGKSIDVPEFPLGLNMKAYPLCRKLSEEADFANRYIAAIEQNNLIRVTEEEMADLGELAFLAAKAADPTLEREAFFQWAIAPAELIDAFFPIRYQTGGWVQIVPSDTPEEEQQEPGEAKGALEPQT